MIGDEGIASLIQRRRRQVLLHSFLYYKQDDPIVSDRVFDRWCRELVSLQEDNPAESESVEYHLDYFRDWDGSSGFNIPFTRQDELKAAMIVGYHARRGGGVVDY
jgi:hypothetical protein